MKLLIRKAVVVDPHSPYHGKVSDLFIENDTVTGIGSNLKLKADKVVEAEGCHVSPGWVDIGVQAGDPGLEHREDLQSAARAAAAGGYTGIGVFPNTQPVIHSKSEVAYLVTQTKGGLVDFFPIGAISTDSAGKQITEMIDMHHAGAIAFSDGQSAVQDNGLMLRALQYVRTIEGIVINRPYDEALGFEGQMHEGVVSTSLGLRGIPNMAEDLMTQRDIYLTDYAGSRIHLFGLSSGHSVDLVRKAKARGLQVSCSVPALNLAFDDRALVEYDSHFKVMPPLRSPEDQEALKAGLKDGAIDLIVSNHSPLEVELKMLEFPYADFGAIGLETAYGLINKALEGTLTTEELVRKLAINPRKLFGLEPVSIREGGKANLTCFLPDHRWVLRREHLKSKSANSPLIGVELKGKVLGVVNNGQAWWAD